MRRRLDLAASLVGRPSVIFLDEPTTGLDPTKRDEVWMTVRGLVAQGATVLLTTQYLDEADALADEISVFDHGRIIAHGTPHELKQIVGDQSLHVRPVDEARLPDVSRVLTAVSGAAPESPRRGVLQVPVRGDEALTEAVARFAAEGIAVTELALKLPGLDEVFAALTGAPTTSDDEEEAA
jgi:oleandomycin transport system ATP-binding protein